MRLNWVYLLLAAVIFGLEVLIALFVHDKFVRPYVGDFLVVIFLYCLVRAFLKVSVLQACIGVLVFSYFIEIMQYLDWVTRLGLQDNRLARIVMGVTFEWHDLLAYTLGVMFVYWIEKRSVISSEL